MNILHKIKNISDAAKASIALMLSSVIANGITYLVTPIYTRLLTPTEFGETSLFLTWLQIFGIIAMFGLANGVFNNGMVDFPDKRDEYSFSMLVLSNIITVAFMGILLCVYPLVQGFVGLGYPLIILMGAVYVFQPAFNFWSARQRYEFKYKALFIWSVISAVITPIVAIFTILSTEGNKAYAQIFGMEIARIAIYIVFYVYICFKNKMKLKTKYWKGAFKFNLPLLPHYLSMHLLSSSNKVMISYLINDAATAYYSVAHSVAAVSTIVWTAINSSLIPYTYEKCKIKDYKSISKIASFVLLLFAVVCVCVIMFAPEVVAIMATPDYMEAIYVIPPIVGGIFFQVQYNLYANVIFYYKKPKYVMIASVTAAFVNISLGYVLISSFGYLAAGYVTLVCYILQAVIDFIGMKKAAGNTLYDMKFIVLLSLFVIIIALFSNLLYSVTIVRYLIVAALFIICFIFRNTIIAKIKEIKKRR